MTKPMVIGLTGPTGAGKTTVSRIVRDGGYPVIDADIVARQVVEPGTPCLEKLTEIFGMGILNANGALNRTALGAVVFADEQKRALLEGIIYPDIIGEVSRQIVRLGEAGEAAVILDAPTLFESGANSICDAIFVVMAPWEQRLDRIMRRDGLTREKALLRMSAQKKDSFYTDRADFVLYNTGAYPDCAPLMQWLARITKGE